VDAARSGVISENVLLEILYITERLTGYVRTGRLWRVASNSARDALPHCFRRLDDARAHRLLRFHEPFHERRERIVRDWHADGRGRMHGLLVRCAVGRRRRSGLS